MIKPRQKKGVTTQSDPVETPIDLLAGYLDDELHRALMAMGRVARESDEAGVEKGCDGLKRLIRLRCALKSVAEAGTDGCAVPRYLVAARFLREAHAAVTPTPSEGLTGVTGPEDGKGIFALERLVTFALAEASPVHAVPDPVSQSDALMALTGAGEQLLATFHSHPGRGPDATHPSKTDLSTQAQLERLGYPAIGAIFSRDGYARFYSKDRAFAVVVSGKGSEKVGDNLFRLKDVERPAAFRRRFAK